MKHPSTAEAAAHLAAIVESSDDVIVSKTLDGIITSWNPTAERVFGYSAAEVVGKPVKVIIPPERWSEEDEVLARIRRGEKVNHFDTVRMTKDGRLLDISLTVSPIRDEDGNIIGASKIARDITDRKIAEQERERLLASEKAARQQAQEASRLKDEFLAIVSHELRTPLNAITGWASLLGTGKLDKKKTQRALDTILRNAQAQNQLIGDLLDVSRIVSGRMRLEIRPFKLSSVIEAAVEIVKPAADAKGIRLQTIFDPAAGPIPGDPDRLQQVFWNLLSNAIKFTSRGGRVQIRSRRTNGHVEIVVSDTGQGIDPKLLPYVFQRFRQGDSSASREYGGLGLGLAIVDHLIQLHGGVVRARSDGEGKGSEFTVELPLLFEASAADVESAQQVHPTAQRILDAEALPPLTGLKILVVDDEPDAREIVTAILTQSKAQVATAEQAEQAIQVLEKFRPDVLISDIGMPNEDGYQLIRKVRARRPEDLGQIPAIALTAFARTQDRLRALSAGYQMHVAKPVEPMELVTVVASLTRRL